MIPIPTLKPGANRIVNADVSGNEVLSRSKEFVAMHKRMLELFTRERSLEAEFRSLTTRMATKKDITKAKKVQQELFQVQKEARENMKKKDELRIKLLNEAGLL